MKRSFHSLKNIYTLRKKSNNFLGSQWAGGVMLVIFAIVALILANFEATKHFYHHLLESDLGFTFNGMDFTMSIEEWINDTLMVVFFFVVGLEIKREIIAGELSNVKKAVLPVAAAMGGMIVPAAIYLLFNHGTEFEPGWGIPMATDIAFAIGILSLLGKKVPISLKIFLTALAIVDDLGAILVIAIFYTSSIDFIMLGSGIAILCLMFYMNRQGITSIILYLIPGLCVWFLFLNSGVHATIAGVLAAMTIPTHPRHTKKYFSYKVRYFLEEFKHFDEPGVEVLSNASQHHALAKVHYIANSAVSPAQRLEHTLNPLVTFIIMPVFALANAGVELSSISDLHILETSQGMGIFAGLVAGKPLGIMLFCWITIKLGWAVMPKNSTWSTLAGVACLGGIGFTMSIFIDNLAFAGTEYIDPGKIAVLMASIASAAFGTLMINMVARQKNE